MRTLKEVESQNIECKETWRDEYMKWICGFANAQGGRIYIGVSDKREIVGVKNSKRLMEDIPNKVATHLGIVVNVNLHHEGELDYMEIVVEPSNIPIAYRGAYHYRSGSTKQELRGTALQQFIMKKMGRSWDDVTCDRASFDDIDRQAIEYFLSKGIEAQRIPEDQRQASTHDVLTNLSLLDDNGMLKNAAVLLFGKNPQRFFPNAKFKVGRFGNDEADLLFHDVIEGNVIQMADRVMDILQAKYLVSPVRFEGMQRYETLEIPKEALREVLYNAIAHKDYIGPDIQMHVYDDHLEIWNEGELPEGYSEKVLMGHHTSKPRNHNIANAMFKAGFIDAWGRGYKKIRDGFTKAGIPMPKVANFCGGVQVSIERTKFIQLTRNGKNVVTGVTKNVPSLSPVCPRFVPSGGSGGSFGGSLAVVQLSDIQKEMCKLIKKDPRITVNQMSVVLSVAKRTLERNLNILQNIGILIREGNTSAGRWILLIDNELEGCAPHNTFQSNTKNDTQGDTPNDTIDVTKNVTKDVIKDVIKDVTKELTDRQMFILKMMANNAFVTIFEMSQKIGVATRTITRDLMALHDKGYIIREGGRKEGHWVILKSINKE